MNGMEAKIENQPPHSSTSGESEEHVLRIKELQDVIKVHASCFMQVQLMQGIFSEACLCTGTGGIKQRDDSAV